MAEKARVHPEQKTLVGECESLCTDPFREALLRATAFAGRLGKKSWIADLRREPGVPTRADQKTLKDALEIAARVASDNADWEELWRRASA